MFEDVRPRRTQVVFFNGIAELNPAHRRSPLRERQAAGRARPQPGVRLRADRHRHQRPADAIRRRRAGGARREPRPGGAGGRPGHRLDGQPGLRDGSKKGASSSSNVIIAYGTAVVVE